VAGQTGCFFASFGAWARFKTKRFLVAEGSRLLAIMSDLPNCHNTDNCILMAAMTRGWYLGT
jgi:hypothetical protein